MNDYTLTPTGYMLPHRANALLLPVEHTNVRGRILLVVCPGPEGAYPHERIEELYTLWLGDSVYLKKYECLREVMDIARTIFGPSLEDFINLQVNNPYLTNANREFIYELVRKLVLDQRDMGLTMSMSLLDQTINRVYTKPYPMPDELKVLWTNRGSLRPYVSASKTMTDALMYWASQKDGITEIMLTLYAILGKHK